MSGICGFSGRQDDLLLAKMTDCLNHRGNNAHGTYYADGVSLGHCRLSVIDIANGRQPMSNNDGSITVVFDGMIYNYRELRHSLEYRGHVFETKSDTEVLLRLFEEEGEQAMRSLKGMFAFAVHDRRNDRLLLARDRLGIRPLYYLNLADRFLFASEVKALLANRNWTPAINPQAVEDYYMLGYIPGNGEMLADVKRLEPGHFLVYRNGNFHSQCYWAPPEFKGPHYKNEQSYFEEFAELMELSVSRRMISDVPIGVHLSGDLDSNVILALMSRFSASPIKTFSLAFEDGGASGGYTTHVEVPGCEHTEITYSASDVASLPSIVYHMDDPLGDPACIPIYKLAKEAKQYIRVILTADGSDEIFGGSAIQKLMWIADTYRRSVPLPVRNQFVEPLLAKMPASVVNAAFKNPAYLGNRGKLKALNYLQMLEPEKMDKAYRHLISMPYSVDSEEAFSARFLAQLRTPAPSNGEAAPPMSSPFLNRLLLLQFRHWLPNNVLLRQDNLFMAHTVENRLPYLDQELVEFVMRLPQRLRLQNMRDKYILRAYDRNLLHRDGLGFKREPFAIPAEKLGDQPLFKEMMNELLSDNSINKRGIFRIDTIAKMRDSVNRQEITHVRRIFSLVVLELWLRTFVDGAILR